MTAADHDEPVIAGPVAWLGDRLVPHAEACLPVWDLGVSQGIAIAEQFRTVRHKLWGLDAHLDRFEKGLCASGIVRPCEREILVDRLEQVARHNAALLAPGDDLSVYLSVSAGSSPALSPRAWTGRRTAWQPDPRESLGASPRLAIWATPVAFWRWHVALTEGLHLVTVPVPELPAAAAPRELKSRSRMHYWLAEQAAQQLAPDALPLLLGTDGFVADTSTGSIATVDLSARRVCVPLPHQALAGVTLQLMKPLFVRLGFAVEPKSLTKADLETADEILWFSTPVFGLPVSRVNQLQAGQGWHGKLWGQMVELIVDELGIDLWQQARNQSRGA